MKILSNRTRLLALIFLLIIFILAIFSGAVGYLVDYQWFLELGYTEVFFKKLITQIKFFIPTFIIISSLIYIYLKSIDAHSNKANRIMLANEEKKKRNKLMLAISTVVSLFFSITFVGQVWYDFLIFVNKTKFNLSDPIFNKDIGYYMFSLPFFNKLQSFGISILILLTLVTVIYNVLALAKAGQENHVPYDSNVSSINRPKDIYKNILKTASKQLSIIGALFFILIAAGFYLRRFDLLYSTRGVAYGASYTDIHSTLPSYYVYIAISILTAILIIISSVRGKIRLAAYGPVLLVISVIASGLVSTAVQSIIVSPNELSKEEAYLQNNIDYTNFAYGLDKVGVFQFDYAQNLNREDIEKNRTTINNIPVNDYRPAKDIYNQIQGLKDYYTFNDIDIDRYTIDGSYRQVFISARELKHENIPKQTNEAQASWINRYLKYTHGYGISLSPVNEVTPSGQPKLLIRDIPVMSDINIKIDRPEIYFGENTRDFIIVNSKEKEFDYPTSAQNVETVYEGSGGIKLTLINRLLFALKEGNLNFLLSQDLTSQSKVIINRQIVDRVKKIAPFLAYDDDPYVVVNNGKLYWIIDAFTTSNRYPYSEPINNETTTNYIRNSVKVVIDAYNGTTKFYIADKTDPIIECYSNIFKTLFIDIDEMPKDLRSHIRYPQTMFDIQSNIYKKYHMKSARELYNKSDMWDIATQIYGNNETQIVESSYLIMKLPDTEKEEFLLMVPYTPKGKPNMIAWLGVKNDGEKYGEMIIYKFPSGKTVEGPMQIEGIVSQDVTIGNTINLLTTGANSKVERGNMMVIPVEDSILYVEPLYLRASNATALPELKKVIVFYKNQVVMEDSLEKSLDRLFPKSKEQVPQKPEEPIDREIATVEELIKRANNIYNDSISAQREGEWAKYGTLQKELQDVLSKLLENTTKIEQNIE